MTRLSHALLESLLPPSSFARSSRREPSKSTAALNHPSASEGCPSLGPILIACDFMRHWAESAATLSEPEWKAGIDIACRCDDGEEAIHRYSSAYPGYDPGETGAKIQRAREGPPPRTCSSIARQVGFKGCLRCPFFQD